jgi:hypothetical protein
VELLDFPVVSLMTLGKDGNFPHLVAVASRQLSDATQQSIRWYGELIHLIDQGTCHTEQISLAMTFQQSITRVSSMRRQLKRRSTLN